MKAKDNGFANQNKKKYSLYYQNAILIIGRKEGQTTNGDRIELLINKFGQQRLMDKEVFSQ